MPLTTASALSTDGEQPMYIESDSADIDKQRHVQVYTGKVILSQGSRRLWADRLVVYTDEDDNVEKAVATGAPAKFKNLPDGKEDYRWGSALRIEYYQNPEFMHLIEKAKLWRGKDVISSKKIIYDAERDRMVSGKRIEKSDPRVNQGPKSRVRITLQPSKAKDAEKRKGIPKLPDGALPEHAIPPELRR
ncbi:MAG: lipopolysaccharide transport periplasmic protein LptA [Gammaproteobacteria bacterium]